MADSGPGFFGRIASAVVHHPRRATVLVILSCLLSVVVASFLEVDPNILELLPHDDPTTRALRVINEEEGGSNLLSIAVQGEDPAALDAFMTDLAGRMEAMPEVDYALYKLDPALTWRLGMMQLTTEELTSIHDRLQSAVALGAGAANPIIASRLLALGPLTDKLRHTGEEGFFPGPEGVARVLVRPAGTAFDPNFSRPFMARVYEILYEDMDPAGKGLQVVWVGGAYRHSVEEIEGMLGDLSRTALLSLGLVFLMLVVGFRELRAVVMIFTPVIVGTLWTWGAVGLLIGTINSFTSFFSAILFGMGMDFAVHLYARYNEERGRGQPMEAAVVRACDAVGPPCATAALASAGGFCALWAAGFQGFQQLGTILAVGVMLCLAASVTILPLLLVWRDRSLPKPVAAPAPPPPVAQMPAIYRLAPLGFVAVLGLTALSALRLPDVQFEFDLSELRRDGLAYEDLTPLQRTLAEQSYAPIVVSYDDAAALAADHARIKAAVQAKELQYVAQVISIHSILPADQPARVALLREISALARHENMRFLPQQVQGNLQKLAEADVAPNTLAPMTVDDLPRSLQHIVGASEGHHRMLLIPTGNMWDIRENDKLASEVASILPDRPAAGEFLATAMLYRLIKDDAPRIAGLALLLIFLFTLLDMRRLGRAILSVLGLVVGISWAGAAMATVGLKLSLVNFVGVPILMGLGIDVVIHLLHRIEEEGPGRIRRAIATTGWAAFITTSTTVLSFAALYVATTQGVRSLGLLIVLGLTIVTLAGFLLVPLGWIAVWRIRGQIPADAEDPVRAPAAPPVDRAESEEESAK